MAHRHGLAGQFGKDQAAKRLQRWLGGYMIFLLLAGGMIGFGLARLTSGVVGWAVAIGMIVGAAALGGVLFMFHRYANLVARERIKYLRGGQTEALIAWLLEELGDEWHIFNNIKLAPAAKWDIDHVLVGPGGVFCISTKSQRGIFEGTHDGLLYNGQRCTFADEALRQTMDLKNYLSKKIDGPLPWLQPVLAVPFGHTGADACAKKVWLVHQENLLERLAPENGPRKVSKEQIDRVREVLETLMSK